MNNIRYVIQLNKKILKIYDPKGNRRKPSRIRYSISKEFNKSSALLSFQGLKVWKFTENELFNKSHVPDKYIHLIKNEYISEIPLWVLEYKELFDTIKDQLYISLTQKDRPKKIIDPQKLSSILNLNINSKAISLNGIIQFILIKLDTVNNVTKSLESNKPFKIKFISYSYKHLGYIYGTFGLGIFKSYIISEKYTKLIKPDPIVKDFGKYIFGAKSTSISPNLTVTYDNLITIFEKFPLKVVYGSGGTHSMRYLKLDYLIENINNFSKDFLEKIYNAVTNDKKYIMNYGDFVLLDSKIKNKIELLFERFLANDLSDFLESIKKGTSYKIIDDNVIDRLNKLPFKATLFEHQQLGVSWLFNLYLNKIPGAILADDMGLGKTIVCIATLSLIQSVNKSAKITIICPASMVGSWSSEIKKFYPSLKHYKIMSYEKAFRSANDTDILILDEAQKIKNKTSGIYKRIASIKKKFTIVLTGTPIENSENDIINILSVINPVFLKLMSVKKYDRNFVYRLKHMINPIFLQRKKSDVKGINLKGKLIEHVDYVNPNKLELDIIKYIREYYHNALIAQNAENNRDFYESRVILIGLMRIRQAISYSKQLPPELISRMPSKIQSEIQTSIPSKFLKLYKICNDVVNKSEKLVVFAEFTGTINFLRDKLKSKFKVATLTGADSSELRKTTIDRFQSGEFDVIIISLRAGNSGITLTTANNIVIYDLWYNPQVLAQAVARVHRIGQNNDVNAHFIVLKNTFDERIYNIIYSKKKLIDTFEKGATNEVVKKLGKDYFEKDIK